MYKEYIKLFIEKAKANHPVIKFTTEVSEIETTFSQRALKKGFVKGFLEQTLPNKLNMKGRKLSSKN